MEICEELIQMVLGELPVEVRSGADQRPVEGWACCVNVWEYEIQS